MNLENYVKIPNYNIFLRKNLSAPELKEKIKESNYFLFDFDGTIYPRLLLSDLTYFILNNSKEKYREKLIDFNKLINEKDKIDFYNLSLKFIKILDGLDVSAFEKNVSNFIERCYPYSSKIVKALNDRKKSCFLVSLTSEFIAAQVMAFFGFKDFFSMQYKKKAGSNGLIFSGAYFENVKDPALFKSRCLTKFGIDKKTFIMFGDSLDDLELFKNAKLKVLVNPKSDFIESVKPDLILLNNEDPWEDFYHWFFEKH